MEFKSFNLKEFEQSSGQTRKRKAQELDAICQSTGFLLLSGHQVSPKLIDAQWNVVSSFFASDDKTKKEVKVPYAGYPYGWIGPNQAALAASKGCLL